jgi:hypothetical protein
MNRGSWLLAFGLSSLVGAVFAPGCSSSSGDNTSTPDSGSKDGTASSSGGDTGAGSSSGDTGVHETGGSSGGEAGNCTVPGAGATLQACITASCCQPVAACTGDPACAAAYACTLACVLADGGSAQSCGARCVADAGLTAGAELAAAGACVAQNCSLGDAGASDAGGGG